jgi:hypothetical protein
MWVLAQRRLVVWDDVLALVRERESWRRVFLAPLPCRLARGAGANILGQLHVWVMCRMRSQSEFARSSGEERVRAGQQLPQTAAPPDSDEKRDHVRTRLRPNVPD